jgi:hypothetical protein
MLNNLPMEVSYVIFHPVRTPSKLEVLGQSSAAKGPEKNSSRRRRRGQGQPPTTESVLSKAFFSTDGEVAHLYGPLLIYQMCISQRKILGTDPLTW